MTATFEGPDELGKLRGLMALAIFADANQYVDSINSLILASRGKPMVHDSVDEQVAIIASSGKYKLADNLLSSYNNQAVGERAHMHLAVSQAMNGTVAIAQSHALQSMNRIQNNRAIYQTARQFYHLIEILGEKGEDDTAWQLIERFPGPHHQLAAKAYFHYGKKDESKLMALISETDTLRSKNSALLEIGMLGARMKSPVVADSAIAAMDRQHNHHYPVLVMVQLSLAMKDRWSLNDAYYYTDRIPANDYHGNAEAKVWIAIGALNITESEDEARNVISSVLGLRPEYRIKFHLRWNNFLSQRNYIGFH